MSFLGKLADAFGFGHSDSVLEDTPGSEKEPQAVEQAPAAVAEPEPLSVDKEKADAIFERVVDIFNSALPDFLSRSVDPAKQRQIIYDSLDQSMREYLESMRLAAELSAKASCQAEHERLLSEAGALKKKAEELEGEKSKVKDKQLSAERQRRALSERVRDLEEQVLKLEAEKEQYEIEAKCMVNKAKASAVLEAEIEDLRSQINGGDGADSAALSSANAKITELNEQISGLEETISGLEGKIAGLEDENRDLHGQVDNLSQGAKVKDEMGDAMLNELQAKAAEAIANSAEIQRRLDESNAALETAEAKLADAEKKAQEANAVCELLRSEAGEHTDRIKELEDEIEDLKGQITDEEEAREEMEEIKHQIELFEQVKLKMDARIEKYKASLKASQREIESLRETIRDNLMDHARQQQELNDRIAELDVEGTARTKPVSIGFTEAPSHPLADADWLVSTPPADSSMRVEDPADFGYQPPKTKPRIETEQYPSLFD